MVTKNSKQIKSKIIGHLDEKEIKEYAKFFEANHLQELTIEEKGTTITFEKENKIVSSVVNTVPIQNTIDDMTNQAVIDTSTSKEPVKNNYREIKSPITGTFYSKPSPDSSVFVKIGDSVDNKSVVCIIEAMKVMNEVTAEVSGKIVEMLKKDGDTVTSGEAIFYVE